MFPSSLNVWPYERIPTVIVRRFPYEEPHLLQVEFWISNGEFSGSTDIYVDREQLVEIGEALSQFPTRVDDVYEFLYGSEDPEKNFYRFFAMKAYTTNSLGRCAIQFAINRNTEMPEEGSCRFSLQASAGAVNKLGNLLQRFAELKHLEFRWSEDQAELFSDYCQEPLRDRRD